MSLLNQHSLQEGLKNYDNVFLFDKFWTNDSWTKHNRPSALGSGIGMKSQTDVNETDSIDIQTMDQNGTVSKDITTNPNEELENSENQEDTETIPNNIDIITETDQLITRPKQSNRTLKNISDSIGADSTGERSMSVSPSAFRPKANEAPANSSPPPSVTTNCRDMMYASMQSLNRWRSGSSAELSADRDREETGVYQMSQSLWKRVENKAAGLFSSLSRKQ